MFNVYSVGNNWEEEGEFISSHKTIELAEKKINTEAKKRVKTVYYVRKIFLNDKTWVYDYGLWNKFLIIREEEDHKKITKEKVKKVFDFENDIRKKVCDAVRKKAWSYDQDRETGEIWCYNITEEELEKIERGE